MLKNTTTTTTNNTTRSGRTADGKSYYTAADGKRYVRRTKEEAAAAAAKHRAGIAAARSSYAVSDARAAENARRFEGIDAAARAEIDRATKRIRKAPRDKSGEAVTISGARIPKTGRAETAAEKAARVDAWIVENGLDRDPLRYGIAAVNSRTRKMLKYGAPVYFQHRAEMAAFNAAVSVAQRPAALHPEPLHFYAADGRTFEPTPAPSALRGFYTAHMVNVTEIDADAAADAGANIIEDAAQECAAHFVETVRAAMTPADMAAGAPEYWGRTLEIMDAGRESAAVYGAPTANGKRPTAPAVPAAWKMLDPAFMALHTYHATRTPAAYVAALNHAEINHTVWYETQRRAERYLRYNGRIDFGKDITETLEKEIERGKKSGARPMLYKARQYRRRVDADPEQIERELNKLSDGLRDVMGYRIAAVEDVRAVKNALEYYVGKNGATAAAVLNMMLSGAGVNDTAAALGVDRRTVSRYKRRLIDIAMSYIRADLPTNPAPTRDIHGFRIRAGIAGRGQRHFGGGFSPIDADRARAEANAARRFKTTDAAARAAMIAAAVEKTRRRAAGRHAVPAPRLSHFEYESRADFIRPDITVSADPARADLLREYAAAAGRAYTPKLPGMTPGRQYKVKRRPDGVTVTSAEQVVARYGSYIGTYAGAVNATLRIGKTGRVTDYLRRRFDGAGRVKPAELQAAINKYFECFTPAAVDLQCFPVETLIDPAAMAERTADAARLLR